MKLETLAPCMDPDGHADDAEWPNNLLSNRTLVDVRGTIFRRGEDRARAVDTAELELCRRLSRDAADVMPGVSVGMGSESTATFDDFFVTATAGDAAPARIDEALVRRAFGGTIFPPATISVEPLREAGVWWSEVLADGEGQPDSYFTSWRKLMAWFGQQQQLVDSAFVRIGDYRALFALETSSYPEGTESPGCVFPRLAVGLTRAGSLAGVFGYVVQT